MKVINKCKKAAILATVLGGMCFGPSADAATVLVGGATDYETATQIGTLNGSWVTPYVDTNVIKNPASGWFDMEEFLYYHTNLYQGDVYFREHCPKYMAMSEEEWLSEAVQEEVWNIIFNIQWNPPSDIFLSNDVDVYRVELNGKAYAFVRQTTGTGTVALEGIVLDLNDWATIGTEQYKGVTDSVNAHAAAGKGKFVYLADYTGCQIGVGELSEDDKTILNRSDLTVNLRDDLAKNAGIDFSDGTYYLHGEGMLIDGDYLYVLANVNKNSEWGNYQPSYLIKYVIQPNGSLKYLDHTTMGKNTDMARIGKYNNYMFTTAIGGYQNYGEVSQYSSLDFANIGESGLFGENGKINLPDNVKANPSEFRNLRILPNGTAYVLCYAIKGGGYQTAMTLYKTTVSNLLAKEPVSWEVLNASDTVAGWFNGVDAEYYTKRVWLRTGNDLSLYVDGTLVHTWSAKDFTDIETLTTMQCFDVMTPEGISGTLAKLELELGEKAANNPNAEWSSAALKETIIGNKSLTGDTAITADASKVDLGNNISAVVYAKDNNVSITAGNLQLQSENTVATPVGIYVGNGKEVNIKADKLNVITKGYEDGNSLTNAIWLDPSAEGTQAKITIEAPVNISMAGGFGGNGIAIQKTDRWGESSTEAAQKAEVIIKGDVSVKGADNETWGIGVNSENVFSRFNNAGILAAVNNSSVTVDGNVYMDVYGNGIATTAQGSTVTVKGGEITVPTGMGYGYYTLGSYLGTINMNTGADGYTPGAETVKLNGDIFALKDTGNINLALTTAESYLNGAIDNGGNVKLYLQNGATWNNEANNTRYYLDSEDKGSYLNNINKASYVNDFVGAVKLENAGVIYQGVNSANIKIDNYSGNVVVLYERENLDVISGGTVTIGSAEEGSTIILRTDYTDSLANLTERDRVMNDLADKLFYTAYVSGERNLTGKVEISEGLMSSSITKYYSDLTFDETTGQGNRSDVFERPKVKAEFNSAINFAELYDNSEFENVLNDDWNGVDFSKLDENKLPEEKVDVVVLQPVENIIPNSTLSVIKVNDYNDMIIEMGGKELILSGNSSGDNTTTNGIVVTQYSNLTIDNVGNLTIEVNSVGKASAIYVDGAGQGETSVTINNAKNNDVVTLSVNSADKENAVLHATNEAKVVMTGKVDITKTNGSEAVMVGSNSEVKLGGGVIGGADDEVAIRLVDGGKIKINQERKHKVVTNGDIVFGSKDATQTATFKLTRNLAQVNAGANEVERDIIYAYEGSAHNGDIVNNTGTNKDFAVEFSDGAQWNGSAQGINLNVLLSGDATAWTGNYDETTVLDLQIEDGATWKVQDKPATKARIANTTNVATMKGEGGFVEMGADAMNIEKYSGSTTFIYKNQDGNIADGGDLTIQEVDGDKATVNLRTGSIGTTEEGKVLETLNDLADKLTYVGSQDTEKTKLSGELQIDEGLMTGTSKITFAGIKFNADGTVTDVTADDVEIRGNNGSSGGSVNVQETTAVRTAKSAMASTVMMWRNESDDVMQRMGDLRLGTEENGIWAKYYNGDASYNEAGTIYSSNYKAYQVGYDRKLDNGWTVGAALSYNDAEHKYEMGAKGEGTSIGVTAYGAWNNDKGHFANVAIKGSKLDNEYNAFNEYKTMEANGDYSTWGVSVSAEYGRRMEQSNGFYFEPSAKLTIGRVQDADYTVTADNGQEMFVEQGGFNSIVGELGVGMGKRLEKGTVYTKLAVAHEFAGDFASSYMDKNSNILNTDADFGGSWFEWQIGGNVKMSDNSYFYATYEKAFGGDAALDWRVDAGMRFSF